MNKIQLNLNFTEHELKEAAAVPLSLSEPLAKWISSMDVPHQMELIINACGCAYKWRLTWIHESVKREYKERAAKTAVGGMSILDKDYESMMIVCRMMPTGLDAKTSWGHLIPLIPINYINILLDASSSEKEISYQSSKPLYWIRFDNDEFRQRMASINLQILTWVGDNSKTDLFVNGPPIQGIKVSISFYGNKERLNMRDERIKIFVSQFNAAADIFKLSKIADVNDDVLKKSSYAYRKMIRNIRAKLPYDKWEPLERPV